MPVFRPLQSMRRHFAPAAFPYALARVYDDVPASGRLLAQFDLSTLTTTVQGSTQVSANPVSTTVLLTGFPVWVRFQSTDGLTFTDVPYAMNLNAPDPTHEIVNNDPPDDSVALYLGQWMVGTTVEFGAGDLVYTP